MSQTESKIKLIFEGVERGVASAAAKAEAAIKSLDDKNSKLASSSKKVEKGLLNVGKGLAGLGAAGNAVSVIGGVAGSLAQLAPSALVLPGVLLSAGAAFGTLKLATYGFGEAISAAMSGDYKTFKQITGAMAPEAAKAAQGIAEFANTVRTQVQADFWGGFKENLDGIGESSQSLGQIYIPILDNGLGAIAKSFAQMFRLTGNVMKSPLFSGAVESILYGTALALKNASPALGSFLTGFVRLGAVGTSYLPKLGTAISDVSQKFSNWVDKGVGDGSIRKMIDNALQGFKDLGAIVGNVGSIIGSVFKGLGANMASPLANLRELTTQLADFLKTADAQEGLRALGDVLQTCGQVMRDVLMAALRQLAPLLVDLAPSIKVIAETIGALLVGAINTAGPILRGIAVIMGEFPVPVAAATVAVVGFVAAVRTIKAINAASEFLGLGKLITGVGTSAEGAGGKVGGFVSKMGLLKGIGVAVGLAAAASAMDEVNKRSSQGNLSGWNGELHDLQRIMSGDWGNPLEDVANQMNATVRNIQSGNSPVGQFFGWLKRQMTTPLPPVNFDVNTGPGRAQVNEFLGQVNRAAPQVNINGNTNGAGFALREILSEIAQGKQSVTIDGQSIPAQDALKYVVGLINNSTPLVDINGNPTPAGDALANFLRQANTSTGIVTIDGNKDPATGKITQTVTLANGSTGTITVDGNPDPATGKINGSIQLADGSTGTITIDGNQQPANGKINATVTYGNGQTATIKVDASTGAAQGVIDGFIRRNDGRQIRIFTSTLGSGGIASAGRLASGGPVRGPGTGTSDTAGLYALSNGEYVLTAKQVRNAGGFAGVGRFARASEEGRIRGFASGGPVSSGLSSAVNELYERLQSGGSLFEDLSFRGMSGNLGKYNDQIADMFYGQGNKFSPTALKNFLFAQRQQAQEAARRSSSPALRAVTVNFSGNTSDALATVIMQMIRTGKIQIKAA